MYAQYGAALARSARGKGDAVVIRAQTFGPCIRMLGFIPHEQRDCAPSANAMQTSAEAEPSALPRNHSAAVDWRCRGQIVWKRPPP